MSIKTLRKRIALVAVASLGFGLMSVVPASAAASWACTTAYVTTPTCNGVVGGYVKLTFTPNAVDENYTVEVTTDTAGTRFTNGVAGVALVGNNTLTGGTTAFTVSGGTAAPTFPTGIVQFNAGSTTAGTGVLTLTATQAGTVTIKATKLVAGVPSTVTSQTVTWIASGTNAISQANSVMFTALDGACAAATSPGAALAIKNGANALNTDYYVGAAADTAVGELTDICIYTFDGNGAALTPATITVFSNKGYVSADSDTDPSAASASVTVAGNVGKASFEGDGIQKGTASITAIVTDSLGNTISLSHSFVWFGNLAKVVLSNNYYANNYAAAAADTTLGDINGMISVTALDANNNVIPFDEATANNWLGATTNFLSAANTDSATALTVSSDKGNGSTATLRGQSNAWATVVVDGGDDDGAETEDYNGRINVTCAEGKYEKLDITLYGYDAVAGTNTIKSNTVSFYCSGAVSTIGVTVTGNSVNISAKDANGYPVADGTAVTLAASNGSVVAPTSKTTYNGAFATAATVIPSNTAASSTVTAIIGSKSGTSATISGTGVSIESQITSLVAAIAKLQKAIAKINKRLKR